MIELTRTAQTNMDDRDSLIEAELNTLYQVSQVLSRSLQLRETLDEVLKLLDSCGLLSCGMVCLREEDSGELIVCALHDKCSQPKESVRYLPGEGIIGVIMAATIMAGDLSLRRPRRFAWAATSSSRPRSRTCRRSTRPSRSLRACRVW